MQRGVALRLVLYRDGSVDACDLLLRYINNSIYTMIGVGRPVPRRRLRRLKAYKLQI